jgi:sodium/potassium-transporting ATPase subunit alpha
MPRIKPVNSSVIAGYELLKQTLELQEAKDHLAKIQDIQKKRRVPKKDKKKKKEEPKSTKIDTMDMHKIPFSEFNDRLKITEDTKRVGLTQREAEERNKIEGDNRLSEGKKEPWFVQLFHELTSFFSLLLWAGAILCFIAYGLDPHDPSNLYLGIVLAVVVFVTGLVTFMQNAKSDSIMEGFKNFIPPKCTVIRDGKEQLIDAAKLVTGDLIEVKVGERIPADIRITMSNEMKVDNSSLTGESDPLLRAIECSHPKILETKNIAFFGTLCNYGKGKGIVINIGDATIIGQIAGLADTAEAGKTPIRLELDRFIKIITIIALSLGVLFFCLGFILKYTPIQNLVFAIGIIVANVPEGLLATITITLSVAAKKLSTKKVLVKNLESVETLGSTSCICSDKTGTLTQNKMTVENLWYNLNTVLGDNKEKKGEKFNYQYDVNDFHFDQLRQCAVMNSTAVFTDALPDKALDKISKLKTHNPEKYKIEKEKIEKQWKENLKNVPYYDRIVIGDASETALVKFFQPIEDVVETRNSMQLAKQFDNSPAVIGFNSAYKFALNVYELKNDDEHSHVIWMKGAPERVWDKCKYVLADGKGKLIDESVQESYDEANKVYAKNGERVLGFARLLLKKSEYPHGYQFNLKNPLDLPFPKGAFEFVGLISLVDPPREMVPDAILKCKTAGIKVIMVTGDQQLTASAIAKKIGIFEDKTSLEIAEEQGIPYEEALDQAEAIVVNGDLLTKVELEDEGLPEKEKGKKLQRWLQKSQIVFARTSPAQKLYIVKGCQKMGYIVAVTGDGVNDSPAIKQADIGIAMGIAGSDVAKDAADMILLNDDFSAIILGIEEGRKIFDNLKKSIAYILSSNIPEIIPFLCFIIFAIPLPLSTVLILCVDLGTDILVGISFAFEEAELDIMTRLPRYTHMHLVNAKLLTFAYLQMGILQTAGCLLSYFIVFDEFGFSPEILSRIIVIPYLTHNPEDIYDPTHPFLGNSNAFCDGGILKMRDNFGKISQESDTIKGNILDWLFTTDINQDLRMGYLDNDCGNNKAKALYDWPQCEIFQISNISRRPVCFSTEALKYAQTATFFSIVMTQFSNSLCCKTRKLSLFNQGIGNNLMIIGWGLEFFVSMALAYIRPINLVFGTRPVIFLHFGFYSLFFSMSMLIYDEIRKYLIRNYPTKSNKPNWFVRNTLY